VRQQLERGRVGRMDTKAVRVSHGGEVIADIPVGRGQSCLGIALQLVEALVKDCSGMVTEVNLNPAGEGTFMVRLPGQFDSRTPTTGQQ
jgi:hypothetical protein